MMMLLYSSLDSLLRQGFLSYDEQPPHTVVLKPFSIMASLVDQNLFALSGLKGNASDISHAMACYLYKPPQFSLHTRESGPDGKQLVGIVESRSLSRFYHIPQWNTFPSEPGSYGEEPPATGPEAPPSGYSQGGTLRNCFHADMRNSDDVIHR